MIKKKIHEVLKSCSKARIGLPALNYSDMWDLMAIAAAADKMKIDVMVASNPLVVNMLTTELCQSMVDAINKTCSVALYNHLDHSSSVDLCIKAVDTGYPSVMIDGSSKSLEQNIQMTKEVVTYAHKKGVLVEGEIGRIKGKGIEGDFEGGAFLAETEDAVELVEKTGVDSLAVGIGTAHGFYTEEPSIHFDRLKEIAAAVPVPLVLHGGTGISDDDIRKAIKQGITKVNVGTIIHITYLRKLKNELNGAGDCPYTLDVMKKVLPDVEDIVCSRIKVITEAKKN